MTAPVSCATFSNSAVVGPGISSASAKFAWSSLWQKYWDRNNSGRQMIWAPSFAASRMRATAFARFAAGSVPHCIWINAILVFSGAVIGHIGPMGLIRPIGGLADYFRSEERRVGKEE